ncbi:ABC transporter permease [Paenibacillus timonensis]|uniref:ABC transporter permease n=1 Tax=Paenibacillus timonensis TaxID=225915 RepID=A0ABW3SH33_9BACL|nr:ABC transporter permease [Paenibacillus timonensis]MCH1642510.1 ABC transporter permease [Paenibacillus timonensis]
MRQIIQDIFIGRKIFIMLFVGFLFTILPIQIALSTQSYFDEIFYDSLNGHFRYYYSLEITNLKEINLDELQKIAKANFGNSSVITNDFTVNDPEHGLMIITGLLNNKLWSPPILNGTMMESESNEIIVGKIVSNHVGTINVLGSEYNVVGIAGRGLSDAYHLKAYIHLNSLPDPIKSNIERSKSLKLLVRSNQNPKYEISSFISKISELDNEVKANMKDETSVYKQAKDARGMVKEVLSYPYQLITIALINCIIVSYLWIYLKRKDIALRKALGASNLNLFVHIITQLLLCAFLATLGSIFIQLLLTKSSAGIFQHTSYLISASSYVFILASLVTVIIALITSIVPVLHILKIEPAKALKE